MDDSEVTPVSLFLGYFTVDEQLRGSLSSKTLSRHSGSRLGRHVEIDAKLQGTKRNRPLKFLDLLATPQIHEVIDRNDQLAVDFDSRLVRGGVICLDCA